LSSVPYRSGVGEGIGFVPDQADGTALRY